MSEDEDETEYEASLRRAFVDRRFRSIGLYSRHNRFQCESAAYGERMGWLEGELIQMDEQSSMISYKLTEKGRRHFGI